MRWLQVVPLVLGALAAITCWKLALWHVVRDDVGIAATPPPRLGRSGVCAGFESLGLYRQAEDDFARYAGNWTQERAAAYSSFCSRRAQSACLTVVVSGGRLYVRHFLPGYQSRHRSTLHAIYRTAMRFGPLPDALFVVEVTDGAFNDVDLPVFMIARPADRQLGILYPDFTFFSWPEARPGQRARRSPPHAATLDAYVARPRSFSWPDRRHGQQFPSTS